MRPTSGGARSPKGPQPFLSRKREGRGRGRRFGGTREEAQEHQQTRYGSMVLGGGKQKTRVETEGNRRTEGKKKRKKKKLADGNHEEKQDWTRGGRKREEKEGRQGWSRGCHVGHRWGHRLVLGVGEGGRRRRWELDAELAQLEITSKHQGSFSGKASVLPRTSKSGPAVPW